MNFIDDVCVKGFVRIKFMGELYNRVNVMWEIKGVLFSYIFLDGYFLFNCIVIVMRVCFIYWFRFWFYGYGL